LYDGFASIQEPDVIPPAPSPSLKSPKIRVLIVDDMEQVRKDLRFLLQVSGEVEVVGEAADGLQAIQQAELLHPDVVVMDLEMPRMSGLQATTEIKRKGLASRVVILSVHSDPQDMSLSIQAGADYFIQKGSSYAELIQAIKPTNP
jgi:DNA-binding NarL/FixJ family response regulator